jgi:2-dehydro-3-deoxyphosphogluconate aldolase/(4S)-4-hydroxy-2-oxoglutarate aldolase
MTTREEISKRLMEAGLIAVIRAPAARLVPPLCEALLKGGIRALEITRSTPDANRAIAETLHRFEDALVGVGTVLDRDAARAALDAGAQFVVSPILQENLIETTHAYQKPVMLGSYTPTEAQHAHEAGSDFIKIFPADGLGPGYLKALRAPLPHLRLVPTGGIVLENVEEFVRAGAAALGVGSSLVSLDLLKREDWSEVERRACAFAAALAEARRGSGTAG